jgi:tetratricopeptide (TPR) repeat protein/predicted Ser/Thr protein kinase
MPDRRDSDVTPTPPGAIIGHYEILAELGRGGMGVLYRARDQRLGRVVALKRPYAPGVVQRQRFEREARAAAQLAHPHIVPIFEVLEQDGVPWIAMELVEGRSLRSLLDLGEALPLPEILRHAEGLAGALQAAHARGILHRDVNPKNVMITTEGRAVLTDFGLARVNRDSSADHDSTDTQENDVTRAGSVLGTPGYMSPEQALGRPADPRSDLFCLGAVLYEMCTRTRAFSASDTGSALDAVLNRDPPAVALCRKDCPPELERIVRKLLAKDASDRYQNAGDVSADLRALRRQIEWERYGSGAYASGGYSGGRNASRSMERFARTRPRTRLLATGIALVAILGATAMLWPGKAEPGGPISSVLIGSIENGSAQPSFGDTLREGLVATLGQSPQIRIVRDDQVDRALERMKLAMGSPVTVLIGRELCQREGIRGLLSGRVRQSGETYALAVQLIDPLTGNVKLVETAQFKDPSDLFSRVDALAERVRARLGESMLSIEASSLPLEQATTPSFVALQLYSEGRRAARSGDFASAIALFSQATAEDADFALAHAELGHAHSALGHRSDAIRAYERALQGARATSRREQGLIAANYYRAREEYGLATNELRALVAFDRDDAVVHQELAQAYEAIGNREAGIRELRECIRLIPTDERSYGNLMLRLVVNGQAEESLATFEVARTRGIDSPYLSWGLGVAQQVLGREDEARAAFANLTAAGGPYSPYGRLYDARTDVLFGKWEDASQKLGTAVAIFRDQRNHSFEVTSRLLLARLRIVKSDIRAARHELESLLRENDLVIRANELRQIGTLLAQMGAVTQAKSVLARLRGSVDESTNSPFVRSCIANLEGEIALSENRDDEAFTSFAIARAAYPQYASMMGMAKVHQKRGQWSAAAEAWKEVIASSGDILRHGFPGDLPFARAERARMLMRSGLKDEASRELDLLRRFWSNADPQLVEEVLSQARAQASTVGVQVRTQGET